MLKTGEALNNSRSNNLSGDHGYRFNGGMTYRHRFHKRGRTISLNFDGSSNVHKATANNYSLNQYYKDGLEQRLDTVDQFRNSRSGGWGFSTRLRSEEHTSELQSLMRISYAAFCLHKKKNQSTTITQT